MEFSEIARMALDAVTSPPAQLAYSWIGFVAVTTASVAIGVHQYKAAQKRLDGELHAVLVKPGPRPTRKEAKEARRKARNQIYATFLDQVFRSAFFVLFIPFVALVVVSVARTWFFGEMPVFTDRISGNPVPDPSISQLLLYFADQISKGIFFDLMEVFRINFSGIENNTDAFIYSGLVFAFRLILDLFAIGFMLTAVRTVVGTFKPLYGAATISEQNRA